MNSTETSTIAPPAKWINEHSDEDLFNPFEVPQFLVQHSHKLAELRAPGANEQISKDSTAPKSASAAQRLPSVPNRPSVHRVYEEAVESFGSIKKFDGVILSREGDVFWARLFENNSDFPTLEASFDIDDLPPSDRALAVEGAPVVWTLGYAGSKGTRNKKSILYVRRIPPPSREDIARNRKVVEDLVSGIKWD